MDDKKLWGLCERQAECIIAILGSAYDAQQNHAHPGDETSYIIAGLIRDVVAEVEASNAD